ncbi:MAG: TM2 domain-containing protein [Clostridia bacterium]|nr:TM2 domain-containing protein [Clostridia bacterium]
MTENNVRQIISSLKSNLPEDKLYIIKRKLEETPDEKFDEIFCAKFHNPTHILLFSIFLGSLGVDRFLIGDTGLGIGKLLLGWATCGIWPLMDIFFSHSKAKQKNFDNLMMLL